jgi:hypothetical protein
MYACYFNRMFHIGNCWTTFDENRLWVEIKSERRRGLIFMTSTLMVEAEKVSETLDWNTILIRLIVKRGHCI